MGPGRERGEWVARQVGRQENDLGGGGGYI